MIIGGEEGNRVSLLKENSRWPFSPLEMATETARGTPSLAVVAWPPRRIVEDEDHIVALWGEILIVIWRREMRVEALRALGMHVMDLAPRSKSRALGRFVIVEQAASRPSAEAREELVQLSRQCPLAFTAYVYEGDGFDAAAVRGIVTGVRLQARRSFPVEVHPTVADAARWVAKNARARVSAPALEAVVRQLR